MTDSVVSIRCTSAFQKECGPQRVTFGVKCSFAGSLGPIFASAEFASPQVLLWSFILLSSCASASNTNGGEAGYLLRETVSGALCPAVWIASFCRCLVGRHRRGISASCICRRHIWLGLIAATEAASRWLACI